MNAELAAAFEGLDRWLKMEALPIWWEQGADHQRGGFQESLSQDGQPISANRRARVQARQIYAYATSRRLGWNGPWRTAVQQGLQFFLSYYRLPNGLFRTLVHPEGTPADNTVWLYDQAFALLALAEASRAFPDRTELPGIAWSLIEALESRRLPAGGFREASHDHPFQSNPHMHLLEACLAWRAIDDDPLWDRFIDEIGELSLSKFIDKNGALHEFFAEDWSLQSGVAGRIVEPGHQFEWAWLLERWSRLRGREDAHCAAQRLFEIGKCHGVDIQRGVAFDQILDDFSIHQSGARLWPQTERIKAAVILSQSADSVGGKDDFLKDAAAGIYGLKKYLDVPVKGLWRDKMKADGDFVEEPAPASSFYHIVCAVSELAGMF